MMAVPYAEVIGDPVAQSSSPAIHKQWLAELGLAGDFRAARVSADELEGYFRARRADAEWRGCSVTIPHKRRALRFLDSLDPTAEAIGAVNCVVRRGDTLHGCNTDIDGIAAVLDAVELKGEKAVLIGAGGGARAAVHYLQRRRTGAILFLVRDPEKACAALTRDGYAHPELRLIDKSNDVLPDARLIVNASPLGMKGQMLMPISLLASLADHAAGKVFFDMVYKPLQTDFLRAGAANGATTIGGMGMLVGQARAAFRAFFGAPAPSSRDSLR